MPGVGMWTKSNLALDVYFAEGGCTKTFEEGCCLSNLHSSLGTNLIHFRIDNGFGAVGFEKFTTRLIILKAKFVSEEAKSDTSIAV